MVSRLSSNYHKNTNTITQPNKSEKYRLTLVISHLFRDSYKHDINFNENNIFPNDLTNKIINFCSQTNLIISAFTESCIVLNFIKSLSIIANKVLPILNKYETYSIQQKIYLTKCLSKLTDLQIYMLQHFTKLQNIFALSKSVFVKSLLWLESTMITLEL